MQAPLPLPKAKQLELVQHLAQGEETEWRAAINRYLAGDQKRRAELFDLTSEEFARWADQQENLEQCGISLHRGTYDGLYLVPRSLWSQWWDGLFRLRWQRQPRKPARGESRRGVNKKWEVYWQERGHPDPAETFENFNAARRYALAQRLMYYFKVEPLAR